MKRLIRPLIRWPFGYLILFTASCKQEPSYHSFVMTHADSVKQQQLYHRAFVRIAGVKDSIRNGDLITRKGNDFTSESLSTLNRRDHRYSHCGIASIENDTVFVYHALGGDFNPDQKIRRDPLEVFAEPYTNRGIGIFRFSVADSIKGNFVKLARSFYDRGIMFDMDFSLKTKDRMYCAEYVYCCFTEASHFKLAFNHSYIKDFEFIGVDDLFLHPQCRPLSEIVYK